MSTRAKCPTCGAEGTAGIGCDATKRTIDSSRQPLSLDPRIEKRRMRARAIVAQNGD